MIPAWLRKFLENTTLHKKIGICEGTCNVTQLKSGSSLTKSVSPSDRFMLQVPYAADIANWEVIFNHNEPDFPPDFIFDCHNFEPNLDNLEHLINWDARDPVAFSNVIDELYNEYKAYQVRLLSQYPRLQTIYNYLTQIIDESDIEVYHSPSDNKNHGQDTVIFLIKVVAAYDKIPKEMFNDVEGNELMLLTVKFYSPETTTRSTDQISLSSKLQQVFGSTLFPQLQGSSKIAQYITELKEFIDERIEMLDNGVTKRKSYIDELVSQFNGGIMEVDVTEYYTASVLIDYLDFNFILQVSLPRYFPKEQPKLTFRSIYHTDDSDKPFSKHSRTYPWSPRWPPAEMIKRLQTYIQEVVTTFQKASVTQGTALKSSAYSERPPDYEEIPQSNN